MIRSHDATEADLLIAPHCLQHIRRPIVVESLHESIGIAPNIAEMHKMNMFFQYANSFRDVHAHCRETTLTKGQPIIYTGYHGKSTLESIWACENSADPSDRRNRGIIGMKRQLDTGSLSNGNDAFDEIGKVVPESLFADVSSFSQWSIGQ